MKRIVWTNLLLLMFQMLSWGNGGPIYTPGVDIAGNPYFKNCPEVEILREKINIYLLKDGWIQLDVHYLLNNTC